MSDQPHPDWVESEGGLTLVGGLCAGCGRKFFPAKPHCPGCGEDAVSRVELSRRGRLYSHSTIHIAPRGFVVPYTVGFVDFPEDDVRVFGQIEGGAADLVLDGPMEPLLGTVRLVEEGDVQGYKFRKTAHVA